MLEQFENVGHFKNLNECGVLFPPLVPLLTFMVQISSNGDTLPLDGQ